MSEPESESYHTTGRGGAGNIHPGKSPEVKEGDMGSGIPHLKSEYYTTGRGGAGNIQKNEDDKVTRLAQDVDKDSIEPTMSNRSVGRGGYGNVQRAANKESNKDSSKDSNKKEESLFKRGINFLFNNNKP